MQTSRSIFYIARALEDPEFENWRLQAWNRFLDMDLTNSQEEEAEAACRNADYEEVRALYEEHQDG